MTHLEKQLQQARPKLRVVSPLAHWTVMVMGWFNIVLGLALFFILKDAGFTTPLLIVNDFLTFQFWGVVFFTLGVLKLYSLYINNWALSRRTLLMGVSVKAAWMIALIIRIFMSPGTAFLSVLWVTVALLQMGAYVYFTPPSIATNIQDKEIADE